MKTVILYLISFLDSLNFGLIMPVLTPHILSMGGSNTSSGVLSSLHSVAQLLAIPLVRTVGSKYGQKNALLYSEVIALLSNLLTGFSTSVSLLIISRLIFYLTNQTQSLSKLYVMQVVRKEQQEFANGVMAALGVAGFLMGPIVGGYMYQFSHGFSKITVFAASSSLASILLTLILPTLKTDKPDSNLFHSMRTSFHRNTMHTHHQLSHVNFQEHRAILLLRGLIATSLTSFFMKFALLLKAHHHANSSQIGYTIAYQSIVVFLANLPLPHLNNIYPGASLHKRVLVEVYATLVSMILICFTQAYHLYLLMFIPLAICRMLLDSLFREIWLASNDKVVEDVTDVLVKTISVLVPIMLGITCDFYGYQAVQAFCIFPLVAAAIAVHLGYFPVLERRVSDVSVGSQSTHEFYENAGPSPRLTPKLSEDNKIDVKVAKKD